jgi:hypothetical protein
MVKIESRIREDGEEEWCGYIAGLDYEYVAETPDKAAAGLVELVLTTLEILRATVAPNLDHSGRIVGKFAAMVGDGLDEAKIQVCQAGAEPGSDRP